MSKQYAKPTVVADAGVMNEAECADYLRQKPRTIRLWRKRRGLPFIKLTSKVVLFRRPDVDGWLAQHRVAMT